MSLVLSQLDGSVNDPVRADDISDDDSCIVNHDVSIDNTDAPILATHYDKSIGGCQGAERRGVFDFFTEILLPDTVEQALAVFDFYLAQQNQVTDNRIRQVTSPRVGLCISDGT